MIITKTEVWHVNHFIHDEGKNKKIWFIQKWYHIPIRITSNSEITCEKSFMKTQKNPSFEWTLFNFFYSNKNNHAYLILLQTINATFSIRGWKRNKASLSWLTID